MCAISGIFSNQTNQTHFELVKKFNIYQAHRGPDNSDIYRNNNIIFGHNRLSILDLSKNGSQPMVSNSDRFVITFNGEIYNHLKLRNQFLINHKFRGTSDTETLIELIEKIGLSDSLKYIEGMFAFGLWDKKEKKLFLIRDKFGEKPLFYGFYDNALIFSSELKSFEIFRKDLKICQNSIQEYLSLSYIPAPKTIYENIFKLEPGSLLSLNLDLFNKNFLKGFTDIKKNKNIKTQVYWSPFFKKTLPYIGNSFQDYKQIIKKKIEGSIKDRMISDVPIGVFLSGGIDSSLVASIMREYSNKNLNTFTISSENSNFDEGQRAKEISNYLGANHHSFEVSKNQQLEVIDDLSSIYDEPFSDSSQIPTIILSKYTKDFVKVVLTGDGADEIFYGYNRYVFAKKLMNKVKFLPKGIKKIVSKAIQNISPKTWITFQKLIANTSLNRFNVALLDEKMYKISDSLTNSNNLYECYFSLLNIWQENEKVFRFETNNNLKNDLLLKINKENRNFENSLNLLDISSYLPDDILVKTDRATMRFGLEARAPYLSNELLDITKQMPINLRTQKNKGKIILREILSDYLPNKFIDGPKKGFSIPMNDWLCTSLKDWAEDLFNSDSFRNCSNLNHKLINKYWMDHKSKKRNHHKKLWNILILIDWMNKKGFSI